MNRRLTRRNTRSKTKLGRGNRGEKGGRPTRRNASTEREMDTRSEGRPAGRREKRGGL